MPNEPYVEQIMVADGDGDNPDVEEVKYETVHDGGGGGGTNLDTLPDSTNDISDEDLIVSKENDGWVKKTALKLLQYIGIFYGTTAEWEVLTTAEKDKYKLIIKTDDNVNAITSAYDIPYGNTSIGNILDKYTPVTLWTGDVGNYAGTNSSTAFNLSQSYKNFKFLRFYYRIASGATVPTRPMVREISTEQLDWIRTQGSGVTMSMAWGYAAGANPPDTNYVDVQPTSTDTVLYIASKYCKVQKIEGIEQIVHTQINSIDNQVFDSDEHEIGTFFGKTLYRRAIYLGNGTDYGLVFDGTAQTAVVNLATLFGWDANYEVVSDDIKMFRADGGSSYFSNNTYFTANAWAVGWYKNNSRAFTISIGKQYMNSAYENTLKIVLVIEYTKERIW